VECGFLSNPREEELLRSEGYQLKLAGILFAGYSGGGVVGDVDISPF